MTGLPRGTIEDVRNSPHPYLLGSDECGYGSWAGPIFVVAAVAPKGWSLPGLKDSKQLSKLQRQRYYETLLLEEERGCIQFRMVESSRREIDEMGAGRALKMSHEVVVTELFKSPYRSAALEQESNVSNTLVVADGDLDLRFDLFGVCVRHAISLIKADEQVPVVAAASVIAKVRRDALMCELHKKYPMYSLSSNMGYGTPAHLAALKEYGPSKIHRLSYRPVREAAKTPLRRSKRGRLVLTS